MIQKFYNELKEGMITAEDIRDASGRLLVAKGTELSESLIFRLTKIGAAGIYVEGESSSGNEKIVDLDLEEKFNAIENRVNKKFQAVKDSPLMAHLALRAANYLKENLKKRLL